MTEAVACTTEQTQLGEGTRWDARRDELLHVDILAGRVYRDRVADDHHDGGGALYRVDGEGRVERVLDGLTIPNGMGWSTDGRTMYLVDSGPRTITAFDFDPVGGQISSGRVLVAVPDGAGSPDGMTVDAAGDLWVAFYAGWCVRQYSPDGLLRSELSLPAEQATCCAFAGEPLSRLYVTTATEFWTPEQRGAAPAAGLVYRFDTTAVGLAAEPYVPSRRWWIEDPA